MPLSIDGLQAAFAAFAVVGSDEENRLLVLKLMAAIEAYLNAASAKDAE